MTIALVHVVDETRSLPSRFDRLRTLVLDGVAAENSKRNYALALDELCTFCNDRQQPISRTLILAFRTAMLNKGLSASTINEKMAAIRKLVMEAQRAGAVSAEETAQTTDVRQQGTRLGNWLTKEQAKDLLAVPVGCALRRTELAELEVSTIQLREGRWVLADVVGKERRIPTVAVPFWVKKGIAAWQEAPASARAGCCVRSVRMGRYAGRP